MKKNFLLGMIALLGMGFISSCTKKVEVKVGEIEGSLQGAFTVAEGEYEVQKADDGTSFIEVDIKRTEESVPYTKETISVFGQDVDKKYMEAGFGFEGFDRQDVEVEKVDAADNDYSQEGQLKVLNLKKGQTGKLAIRFKDNIPASIKLTSDLKIIDTGLLELNGAIGKYGVKNFTLNLNVKKKELSGKYQYLTSPAGAFLYLNGKLLKETVDDDGNYVFKIEMQEAPDNRDWSGSFDGALLLERESKTAPYRYILKGTFLSYQFKTYEYNIKSEPIENE